MSVLVLGSPEDLELAGAPPAGAEAELVVALRDPSLLAGVEAPRRLAWLAGPTGAAEVPAGCEVIAPAGEPLWRRAPWPAADALFELEPPESVAGFLVVAPSAERRERVAERLAARGHTGSARERLTLADLRGAGAVALLSAEPGGALPVEAPAVAAAGRVLVTDAFTPDFGLQPGVDLLGADGDAAAVEALDAALTRPAAFAAMRALAAHAAQAHRASEVYARLLADTAVLGA